MIEHANGLLLCHVPINAEWYVEFWKGCDAFRQVQAMEFVRPDGTTQRPGYWLQLTAFGDIATKALAGLTVPPEVAANPRRVPSPMAQFQKETSAEPNTRRSPSPSDFGHHNRRHGRS
jgi:hypothetical protein